jgi:ATP-binding cassette subfamily F protein 3
MIDVSNLSLAYGERDLFDDISFQLGDSEKVCLAGPNGSGKSTLLKLLCGEIRPDGGSIIRSKSVKVGYLRQHLGEDGGLTVFQAALEAFGDALKSSKELDALHTAMANGAHPTDAELERMDFLQDELIHSGFYTAESETRKVLHGLGFEPEKQDVPLGSLSGGWRMRVALAKVLLSHPTCLFLDEPTNHLDLESIVWLESYIRNYSGCLVLISHDRQFVDRTCDRIIEIQSGALAYYPLPYSRYEAERVVRREQLLREYKKQQDEIAGLERFVERFKAKASKATQAQSKQRMLDKIDRIELPSGAAQIKLKFLEAPPSGQWVFEAENLTKKYGDLQVFKDGKFALQAREKVVLVGPNGAGKTTLLKLLLGIEKPTDGTIVRGANVQVGYFAQYEEPTPVEAEMDLISYLAASFPKMGTQQIRGILGAMLFSDDDAFKKFGILSGGERSRVRLCRLLLQNCNVIVLDEPTNHLDMDSKTLLMEALHDFGGTVLFVSHDRHFVENVASRVLLVKNGRITDYPGDYAYYCRKLATEAQEEQEDGEAPKKKDKNKGGGAASSAAGRNSAATPKSEKPAPAPVASIAPVAPKAVNGAAAPATPLDYEAKKEIERLKRKAEKRWAEVETAIAGLDLKLSELDGEMCKPEVYSDPEAAAQIARDKKDIETQINGLYRELEGLEAEGYGR